MPRPSRYHPDTLDPDAHWTDHAACKNTARAGVEFFPLAGPERPPKGERGNASAKAKRNKTSAKADARHLKTVYCRDCPVRMACLEHALTRPEVEGVWGGLDWDELAQMRAQVKASEAEQQAREQAHDAAAGAAA
jgi:WhiB family redox-sensing transcriptional regulator